MIELPEACTIARQMTAALPGKRIAEVTRGNSSHKFAFFNQTQWEYAARLVGQTVGAGEGNGSYILLAAGSAGFLMFGNGGERILLHLNERTLPKKYHFLIRFDGQSFLSITVQGWGFAQLIRREDFPPENYAGKNTVDPTRPQFTPEFFESLFSELKPGDKLSVKFFMISKPGVWGVGNGCLQDILFRARLHPRHPAAALTAAQRRGLYDSIRATLQQAVNLGGRDSEADLYGCAGGYARLLDSSKAGQPCIHCVSPIEKDQYLGGAVYFCPRCQVVPTN